MPGTSLLTGHVWLGTTVALAILADITQATTLGAGMPIVLMRSGFDPAPATAPLLSTLSDIVGFAICLLFAHRLMVCPRHFAGPVRPEPPGARRTSTRRFSVASRAPMVPGSPPGKPPAAAT